MSRIDPRNPIAITGIGVVSPDAMNVQELVAAVQSPHKDDGDGVRPLTRFDPKQLLGERGFKYLTPATRYALAATRLAMDDADLKADTFSPEEKGVFLGTNFAIHKVHDAFDDAILSQGVEALQPMRAPNFTPNIPASYISIKHQFLAFNVTLTNTIVAGLEAVILGANAIGKGRGRLVLAGATESKPPERVAHILGGTVAEGAACALILEPLPLAQARRARIYACVGPAALWFVPPSLAERGNAEYQFEAMFRKHLDGMSLADKVIRVCTLEMDHFLCRMGNECLSRCLREYGAKVEPYPASGLSAAEGCVSPLLGLAASVATHGEVLVFATSPFGHMAMLRLGSEDKHTLKGT